MKIAFNPLGSGALTKAPDNKDITFDLVGRVIYARGVPFDGKNTQYKTFKKHTSSDNTGGSEGLVPIPSYSTTNTRLLREDGQWVNIAGAAPPDTELSTESTNAVQNKVITNKINEILASMQLKAADVYKNIKVGTTTLVASGVNDTLEFKLGNGITITPNATNKTLEFSINATGNQGISTSYSNKQLIVKIQDEYYNKWNAVYDWYISVTEEDTDDLINKWQEIVDFLNSVAEGTDILDEFVTRKTAQTITGVKTFNTQQKFTVADGTSPFTVTSKTLVTNLNADLLDGTHKSGLLTALANVNTTDNPQSIYITVGGTTKYLKVSYSQHSTDLVNTSVTNPDSAVSGQYLKWYSQINRSGSNPYYAGTNTGFPVGNNANGILWLGTHSGPYGGQLGVSSNGRLYYRFITNNTFPTTANGGSWNRIAWSSEVDTLKNYYWADVKISSTSSTTTKPTFATATATISVTTPLVSSTGRLTLNATSTALDLKFNNDNTKSVILNGTEFKPYDDANGKLDLGASDARWKVIYGGAGNFVGNVESITTTSDAVKHAVTNANGSVELLVHSNRGLYDRTNSKWIIYVPNGTSNVYIPTWASRGSSTQPVYFNGNGEPTVCTAYSGLLTALSSSSATNLSITVGGTTKSVADMWATNIANKYSSRPTTIDPGITGDGSMFHFKCTSSVTDTTTDPGDAHILHFNWDNNGGYDFQIAGLTSQSTLKIRGMSGGTWQAWATVLTNLNYTSYLGYIGTTAVQSTSAAQALTGITTANFSGAVTLSGTAPSTAILKFSRSGASTWNYILWPGDTDADCKLAFGYSNTSSACYYYMTNTSFNPVANNARTLGTSSARWSNVYSVLGNFMGNVTLYSSSGDSPHLYFQRGTTTDGIYDWDMFVTGGSLTLRQNNAGTWNTALTAADNYMSTGWRFNVGKELSVKDRRFNYSLAYYNTNTSTITGTIVITLPNGWNASMNTYEIDIYEYNGYDEDAANIQHSKIIISGYNYSTGAAWINYGYQQIGSYNKGVRLGYNGSKCCILLGTTTTNWSYPQIHLSRVITGYSNQTTWSTGYSISVITSESGYSGIVTANRTRQYFADVVANNFRGTLVGNASTATKVYINNSSSNGVYPVTFTNTGSCGTPRNDSLYVDSVSGAGYNPSTNAFVANIMTAGVHNSTSTLYLDSGTATTSIIFRHGTTERMRIAQPNGYVGIGTTAPIHKLQVTGAGVFSNTGSTTYASDGITIGAGDAVARYITCYGKTGLSYINIGYNAAANNSGELHFSYSSSGSTSNYVGLQLYGAANCVRIYPGYTQSIKYIQAPNYVSSVATGTQPYACTSTTLNTNLNADMLDGYHASSFAIWRGQVQTDAEADDTTYTSTPSFLSMLHNRSSVFSTCFSAFRGSWYYVGNINCNTGVGTLEMAGTAVLNISTSTTNNEHSKTLLFIEGSTGNLYSYVKQSDGYGAIWSRYAKTTDIPNPANYYWANVKVSASSSTSTSPTFATATMTRGVVGGYNNTSYALSTSSFICQSWVRTTGATGWYNETYAGGWYMTDTTYVRTYNSKAIYISNTGDHAIYTAGGFASSRTSGSVFATYYNGTWYCDTLYTHGNGNLSISPPGGSLYLAYNRGNTYFGGGTYYINRSGYFNGSCASANYTYRLAASSISDVNAPNWQEPGIRVDIYSASASNKPYSGNNANGVINFSFGKHGTSGHYGFQLAHGNGSNRLYFNQWTSGSRSGWKTVAWTSDIPSVGNGTVTIKQAGTTKGSFTMNQSGNTTIELTDNNTTYSFSNNNPTLAWGTKSTIGTVGGVALTVTMPANPNTNTHWTTRIYAGASGTAANAAATNPYLKVTDDNTYRNQVRFVGGGATTVSSDASGNITISSTNTTYSFAAKGSATQGIYLSGTNTFAAMTYSLKATVNAGTAGNLAYYSGANAISAYTSTVGDYSTPVYISGGVPISCYAKSVGSVTWGTSCSGYIYVYQFGPITILQGYISTINTSNTSSTNYVFKLPSGARSPSTSCGFALVQKDGYSNDRNTVIRLSGQCGYCDANYNDYNPAGSSYYFTAAYM